MTWTWAGSSRTYWQMPRPPDGQEIIFTAKTTPDGPEKGLYAIKPDGTGLRTIGAVSTTESYGAASGADRISFQDPALSPDGTTIAYWSWEPKDANATSSDDIPASPGPDHWRGAAAPVRPRATTRGCCLHFSPDGTMVVYEGGPPGSGNSQLVYAPVDGSQPSRSIGPEFYYQNRTGFDFSPDGNQVILSLDRQERGHRRRHRRGDRTAGHQDPAGLAAPGSLITPPPAAPGLAWGWVPALPRRTRSVRRTHVRCYLTCVKTSISTKGQIVLPAEFRRQDDIRPGEAFEVERTDRGEYRLRRIQRPPNEGVVDWLLECPDKGFFVPIESESTDTL